MKMNTVYLCKVYILVAYSCGYKRNGACLQLNSSAHVLRYAGLWEKKVLGSLILRKERIL